MYSPKVSLILTQITEKSVHKQSSLFNSIYYLSMYMSNWVPSLEAF
jgi:hypothetical protein